MADTVLKIAAISGSLRKASYNTAALRAAIEVSPPDLAIRLHLLHEIPLYNQDVEAQGWPVPVQALRDAVAAADGLLLATPEYNYSIPGVLKNALDWLSRPPTKGVILGKPLAIIGASPGMVGTARAQEHLRQVAFTNQMPLVMSAEVLIARAHEKFDPEGRLTDKATREFIAKLLVSFGESIRRNKR